MSARKRGSADEVAFEGWAATPQAWRLLEAVCLVECEFDGEGGFHFTEAPHLRDALMGLAAVGRFLVLDDTDGTIRGTFT